MSVTGFIMRNGNDISNVFASKSNATPAGTVVSYLGKTDVDGWILCDGLVRNNNSDGRYNALAALSIGSGGSLTNNYTPPNLQNVFLRGADTNKETLYTSGSNEVALNGNHLPSHSHNGSVGYNAASLQIIDISHDHELYSSYREYFEEANNSSYKCVDKEGYDNQFKSVEMRTVRNNQMITVPIPAHTHDFTTNNTGGSQAFSIIPRYVTVNYLLKL